MKRRTVLVMAGGLLAVGGAAWLGRNGLTRSLLTRLDNDGLEMAPLPNLDTAGCMLTPSQVEGPFFVTSPLRTDIREGRDGVPLELQLKLVAADGCSPLEGAGVEIWHCDAAGRYSGYPEDLSRKPFDTMMLVAGQPTRVPPTNGKTYLRGAQTTNADGMVRFSTILPGWYDPRVPHVHVKVLTAQARALTTQLYFPESLTTSVYADHPAYQPHGASPYNFRNDTVLGAGGDGRGLLLQPVATTAGLQAAGVLGVG